MAVDFEAEGMLEGLDGEARASRLELLEKLSDDGVELDELKQAASEGRLALLPVERALGGDGRYTLSEVAERAEMDEDFYAEVLRTTGIARPDPDEAIFGEAEVEGAIRLRQARDAGMSDEDLLEITRAMSRSAASLAAAVTRVFGRSFLRPGDTEHELAERYADAARELRPLLAEGFENVLGLHFREEVRRAAVASAEMEAGTLSAAEDITVCFADLVGFTRLGEKLPADELGAMTDQFEALAVEAAAAPIRLVKMVGDAAMLVSPKPEPLTEAALHLLEAAEAEGDDFPQLHVGLAKGQALGRGGDWYGGSVNLASRLTDFARPGSVVASEEVRDAVGDEGYSWSFAGKRKFKNVRGEVGVFRVRRAE